MYGGFKSKGRYAAWLAHEKRQKRHREHGGGGTPEVPLLALNSRIVYFGDSITAARGFAGYADWSQVLTRGRFFGKATGSNGLGPTGWNQGVVGNTTAQMRARVANVTAENPKVVVVLGGTNDIGAQSRTADDIQTDLRAIYDTIIASGSRVLAVTILKRGSVGWADQQENTRTAVNTWIKSQTDIDYIDADPVITAASTVFLNEDLTHPKAYGAQLLGTQVADKLNTYITDEDILYSLPDGAPAENKFSNPFFTGGTTTATSWALFQGSNGLVKTASKTTWGEYDAQKLTQVGTASANVADNFNQNVALTGFVTGDLVECWVEIDVVKSTGLSGISIHPGNSGTAIQMMNVSAQDGSGGLEPFTGVLRCLPFALTSNAPTLNARLQFIPLVGAAVDSEIIIRRAGYRKVPADL